jgi:hypothetical protein
MAARAPRLDAQPVVEPDGCGEVDQGMEVIEQASGFIQMPPDDASGGIDGIRVDHADRRTGHHMEQNSLARCSRRSRPLHPGYRCARRLWPALARCDGAPPPTRRVPGVIAPVPLAAGHSRRECKAASAANPEARTVLIHRQYRPRRGRVAARQESPSTPPEPIAELTSDRKDPIAQNIG